MFKKMISSLVVLFSIFATCTPVMANSIIEEVDFESNSVVEVEFSQKVSYRNPKVTVKDTSGKSYTATLIEYDNDDLKFYVNGLKPNTKYTFSISGVQVLKTNATAKVNGTFKTSFQVSAYKLKKGWIKDARGWWYRNANGSYPRNTWQRISGDWYHFDKNGYMQTGWQKFSGKWYYFDRDGEMETGWERINNKYYYFDNSGVLQTNKWIGRYHVNTQGVWDKTR